jgi:3-deoxy-7-phosphoheptulonate synthase
LMIDFSHANSRKEAQRQLEVATDVAGQLAGGERRIMGAMVESNLLGGRQDLGPGKELAYGQSITDACIGWDDTETMLRQLADAVQARRNQTSAAT